MVDDPGIVRSMCPKDVKSIVAIEPDEFTLIYPERVYVNHARVFPKLSLVVETKNTISAFIIGSTSVSDDAFYGHISSIYVLEEYRKRGYGSRLINKFEEGCKKAGCRYINLYVNIRNIAAVDFYKNRKYTVYRTIPKYYNDAEDAYEMRRDL
ncbi:N-acetyltransferase, putative [Theileria equi strain WA]|uniref:N-acetyltransferase, putative n=1 Tax=Theileria equi strain WA TaxID=1537102 RepID=L0B0D9_THEEQ|nr:N-acetyltransferase, putative [Theileria equi strain WA]AFZ81285.1 N-acetyltransferase, putative [Theileria equi strain WA]|eukprot:XP_004830951.1 N-acetyltransferase, putative [Theileria equi strain WA]